VAPRDACPYAGCNGTSFVAAAVPIAQLSQKRHLTATSQMSIRTRGGRSQKQEGTMQCSRLSPLTFSTLLLGAAF
jgi:hypothetical protein